MSAAEASLPVSRTWKLLTALFLLAFFVQGATSLRHKSATYDEPSHLAYGRQVLRDGTFVRKDMSHNSKSPVSALNALPSVLAKHFDIPLPPGPRLWLGRLPTLLLGVLLGWLVARWGRQAFGPRAGLAAVALYAFAPNVLAHGRLITTDLVTALGVFASTYALWRYVTAPSWTRLVAAGAVLGLALATKASSLLLLPILAIVLGLLLLRDRLRRRRETTRGVTTGTAPRPLRWLMAAAIYALTALVAVNIVYRFEGTFTPLGSYEFYDAGFQAAARVPALAALPLPLPYAYVQGVDMVTFTMNRDRWSYCLGDYRRRGFRYYFLVGLLTKTTVGFLALLALALGLRLFKDRSLRDEELFLLVPPVFFFVYLSFFFHFDIGFRYFLPGLPFLFVFAAQAVAYRPSRALWTGLATALVVLHIASSLRIYPHYLAYFNEPSGGPLQGWRYLIDSNLDWGQDRVYARRIYAPTSPVPLVVGPRQPTAGRIMVNVNSLVGFRPGNHRRYAWLRENFTPVDHVGYSFLIFDVSPQELEACCGKGRSGPRPAGR